MNLVLFSVCDEWWVVSGGSDQLIQSIQYWNLVCNFTNTVMWSVVSLRSVLLFEFSGFEKYKISILIPFRPCVAYHLAHCMTFIVFGELVIIAPRHRHEWNGKRTVWHIIVNQKMFRPFAIFIVGIVYVPSTVYNALLLDSTTTHTHKHMHTHEVSTRHLLALAVLTQVDMYARA